jgi:hypothetical protein
MKRRRSMQLPDQERSILERLDRILRRKAVRARVDSTARRVQRKMSQDRALLMAWEPIPLSVFGDTLPPTVRSAWVFILRAGAATGAERHPNSRQRMVSYRGTGDLQTGPEGRWQSNLLSSQERASLEKRWVSVPPNVWHQAVVPDRDWVVVSFHTVPAHELVEERLDPADHTRTQAKLYSAEKRG